MRPGDRLEDAAAGAGRVGWAQLRRAQPRRSSWSARHLSSKRSNVRRADATSRAPEPTDRDELAATISPVAEISTDGRGADHEAWHPPTDRSGRRCSRVKIDHRLEPGLRVARPRAVERRALLRGAATDVAVRRSMTRRPSVRPLAEMACGRSFSMELSKDGRRCARVRMGLRPEPGLRVARPCTVERLAVSVRDGRACLSAAQQAADADSPWFSSEKWLSVRGGRAACPPAVGTPPANSRPGIAPSYLGRMP